MDRYLIAVDMDGTLLDSKNRISAYAIDTLKKLQDNGHYIVPASGRCLTLLPPELKNIDNMTYAITESGAIVWDLNKKEPILQTLLPKEEVEMILSQALQTACFTEIFANGVAYTEQKELDWLDKSIHSENFIRYLSENHVYVDHLNRMENVISTASKINLYFDEDVPGQTFRKSLEHKKNLTLSSSMDNVEITSASVNKGTALRFLMERLEIPQSRVIAFGDSENDLEMFEAAGVAVAMRNAPESIRQKAEYTAMNNDHDGVAVFLRHFFENKEGE